MNRYHESMEHCAPPPELEEQLREAVLSAEPEPQARTAVYRPRGFFRKALLAAVLAVVLTLSVGAAVALSILHFIFVLDVVAAVVGFCTVHGRHKRQKQMEAARQQQMPYRD